MSSFKLNPKLIPKNGKSLYENPNGFKNGKTLLKDGIENYKYILILTNIGSFIYYCGNKEHIEFFVSCFARADQVYSNSMVVSMTNNELSVTGNKSWYSSTVIEGDSVRNAIYEIIGFNKL